MKSLQIEKQFLTSAASLYHAWIVPAVAERWLFKNGTNSIRFQGSPAKDEHFNVLEEDQGRITDHTGQFLVMEKNRRLVFTLAVPVHFEGTSEVEILFSDTPAGCIMKFSQKNIDTTKTEDAWNTMFSNLDRLLQSPYQVNPGSGARAILDAIAVTIVQLIALAGSVGNDRMEAVPYRGSWTVAQLLAHIRLYLQFIPEVMSMKADPATRNPAVRSMEFARSFLDPTIEMHSPDFLVPPDKVPPAGQVLEELDGSVRRLDLAAAAADLAEELKEFPAGPVTKLELLFFTFYHSRRHLWQMRKLKDVLTAG